MLYCTIDKKQNSNDRSMLCHHTIMSSSLTEMKGQYLPRTSSFALTCIVLKRAFLSMNQLTSARIFLSHPALIIVVCITLTTWVSLGDNRTFEGISTAISEEKWVKKFFENFLNNLSNYLWYLLNEILFKINLDFL